MKKLLLLLIFFSSLFAAEQEFLEPSEAFKVSSQEYKDKVSLKIKVDKSIYIYDETLKVKIGKDDITKKLSLPKPVKYQDFIVHFGEIIIDIPRELITDKITLMYQGCSKAGLCYAPMTEEFNFLKNKKPSSSQPKSETDTIAQTLKDGNIFLVIATFFGFGLLLALTPCIFPMIPILSSIIVSHSKHGDMSQISASKGFILSLIYVLSMSIAYTIAGVLAGLFGANIQAMLQNPIVIVLFATIFVALAFSMFGYYKLEIPHSWQNKIHKKTNKEAKHGLIGVAIMGFLSALIVGPCVAPPLAGALVYIGQTGDALLGGVALFVMSFGMGLPLLLVGAGAGKYMPKPGGWMDTVSKVFGVIMLGIAIYMLERVISSTLSQLLWIVLAIGSMLYILKINNIATYLTSLLLVFFSIHLLLNIFVGKQNIGHLNFKYVKNIAQLEYELKNTNKPVMLDFWASWCISCEELEEITFANKDVQKELSKYTLLKVDMTNNNEDDKLLQKRFDVFGPPALIFFDKDGKENKSKKIIGFKSPEEFLKIVK